MKEGPVCGAAARLVLGNSPYRRHGNYSVAAPPGIAARGRPAAAELRGAQRRCYAPRPRGPGAAPLNERGTPVADRAETLLRDAAAERDAAPAPASPRPRPAILVAGASRRAAPGRARSPAPGQLALPFAPLPASGWRCAS